jgi:hypothetical protein
MIVKQSVECEFAGETEVLGENLPQRHSVHHKSHMAAVVGIRRLTACAMARPVRYSAGARNVFIIGIAQSLSRRAG